MNKIDDVVPSIMLSSGSYFSFVDVESNVFTIKDIALGLSNTCRFAGQINEFYSVAQHSVLCSYLVPDEYRLDALLHDASEAFISDISTPLKRLLPEYKVIENRIQNNILSRFGLNEMSKEVKLADRICLATEKRDLLTETDVVWSSLDGIKPFSGTIIPLPPKAAFREFIERYTELINGQQI